MLFKFQENSKTLGNESILKNEAPSLPLIEMFAIHSKVSDMSFTNY